MQQDLQQAIDKGLRSGELYTCQAFVVETYLWGEGHKRVVLLSPGSIKIVAQARFAARSTKRFGAALQPFALVKAFLKTGRASQTFENWFLDKVELQQNFLSLRGHYKKMETAAFALNFIRDLVPTGQIDDFFYQALHEFMHLLDQVDIKSEFWANWWKALFWEACFRQMGYGQLLEYKEFNDCTKFAEMLSVFSRVPVKRDLTKDELSQIYYKWVDSTHQTWEFFEKWLRV